MSSENNEVLVQLAQVQGQLTAMTQLMQQNHDYTHQRINDFRHAVEGRIAGVEGRVDKLENNERGTALRGASGGALSAAVVAGAIELMKYVSGR